MAISAPEQSFGWINKNSLSVCMRQNAGAPFSERARNCVSLVQLQLAAETGAPDARLECNTSIIPIQYVQAGLSVRTVAMVRKQMRMQRRRNVVSDWVTRSSHLLIRST